MKILINKKEAVIKAGSSFEFISENRYFTGSDSYTLAIEFPLADCPQNTKIFGHINRKDIESKQYLFDCEIFAGKIHKTGSVTITEINEKTVKCQFLEGRSVQNYDNALDDIYINELALGYWPDAYSNSSVAEQFLISEIPTYTAIPWVNNTSGNLQNAIQYNGSVLNWHPDFVSSEEKRVSFMPFLIYIFKKIFDALEYTYDIQAWEANRYKWLLICNCVPGAWRQTNWNYVLPHWTINEFLEELEKFMNCQFEIDNVNKHVKMSFPSTASASRNIVEIKVHNEITATKTDEDESDYEENMGKAYAQIDSEKFTAMTTTLPRDTLKKELEFQGSGRFFWNGFFVDSASDTLNEQIARNIYDTVPQEWQVMINSNTCFAAYKEKNFYVPKGKLCYYDYIDFHDIHGYNIRSAQFYAERVGEFAPIEPKQKGGKTKELKIVPAIIDEIDYDFAVFLDCGELEDPNAIFDDFEGQTSKSEIYIRKYEKEEQKDVFDKLFVAYWNASIFAEFKEIRTLTKERRVIDSYRIEYVDKRCIPHPIISAYEPVWAEDCKQPTYFLHDPEYSLALKASNVVNKNIEGRVKYTFKFIADTIPDVGSTFLISGQQFLCKKITATFTEKGMSQLLKGEFYRVTS